MITKAKKKRIFASLLMILFLAGAGTLFYTYSAKNPKVVKVGILHSLSGTMSVSEKGVAMATKVAIDEINSNGGIMGYIIEPVIVDGASIPEVFAKKAQNLIVQDGCKAIFGCWTSASRKETKKVVERYGNLLLYPVQYEGAEESGSILYMGQLPNQQIKPALLYAIRNFGDEIFLVGSDYIFPRVANIYIKELSSLIGGKVVGERYEKLGAYDFKGIIGEIKAKKPKFILNTLNGDSNVYFFDQLYDAGISAKEIPVLSFSIAKDEIKSIAKYASKEALVGHYASWSYFEELDSDENRKFLKLMKKNGIQNPTDPMEAAYSAVMLYKQAVEESGSFEPSSVKRALVHQSYKGPGGTVTISESNLNVWKHSRIAKINSELGFEIVEESKKPLRPQNYPDMLTKKEWNEKIEQLYREWDNSWAASK